MFYSQHVLTKKGPLAKIWLAAHMQTKLTKAMVFSTDLRKAVESIISPEVPMALRLTSNLLLGVVRILHRKSKYLLQESSEAMTRLKLAFRSGANTDLPTRSTTTAAYSAITIQPSVDTLNAPNLDLDLLPARTAPNHTSFLAADRDITIDEFAGGLVGGMLDAFALDPELHRQDDMDADLAEPLLFTPSQRTGPATPVTPSVRSDPSAQSDPSAERMRADSAAHPPQGETPLLSAGSREAPAMEERADLPAQLTPATPGEAPDAETDRRAGLATPPVPNLTDSTPRQKEQHADSPAPTPMDTGLAPERPQSPIPPPQLSEDSPAFPLGFTPSSDRGGDEISAATGLTSHLPRLSTGADDDLVLADAAVAAPETLPTDEAVVGDTSGAAAEPGAIAPVAEVPSTPVPATEQAAAIEPATPDATQAAGPTTPEPLATPQDPADIGTVAEEERTPAPRRESLDWQPPTTPETPDTPLTPSRPRERKRKAIVLNDEGATELSASDFRACLNDTTDLLRGPRAPTRRRIDASIQYADLLGRPVVNLAPALRTLFEQSFRFEVLVASPMSDADLLDTDRSDGVSRPEEAEAGDSERREEEGAVLEETPAKPGEESPARADAEETPTKPVGDETPKGPSIEESPGGPFVDQTPGGPVMEETPARQEDSTAQEVVVPPVEEEEIAPPAIMEDARPEKEVVADPSGIGMVAEKVPVVEGSIPSRYTPSRSDGQEGGDSMGYPAGAEVSDMAAADSQRALDSQSGRDVMLEADSGMMRLREVARTHAQVDGPDNVQVTEATVSARTRKMRDFIEEHVEERDGELNFSDVLRRERGVSRRTAARTFYELLNLSSKKAVLLRQEGAFGDIYTKRYQPVFDSLVQDC